MFHFTRQILTKSPLTKLNVEINKLPFQSKQGFATQLKPTEQKSEAISLNQSKKVINPLKHEDFFQINDLVTLEDLFK